MKVTREEMAEVLDRHVRLGDIIQDWDDLVDAATDLANGIRRCPACLGNDADMPCAYPGDGQRGCLRDKRLADPECPLPPTGWRCTRRAGHDGPCAAVVK